MDEYGYYRKGPSSVIDKVLVAGVKLPKLEQNIPHMVDMAGGLEE